MTKPNTEILQVQMQIKIQARQAMKHNLIQKTRQRKQKKSQLHMDPVKKL